jgi:signal transduction histidine kinase
MPHSHVGERLTDDGHLLELALRLCTDRTPDETLQDAVLTLSALLPNCPMYVLGCSPTGERSSEVYCPDPSNNTAQRQLETSDKCEWLIEDHPQSPRLVLTLDSIDGCIERASARALVGRVVTLVSAAMRRFRSVSQVEASAHEAMRLLARLVQTEKLASYGQVVAGVLHDLNNPLTAILAYSDYLNRTLPSQNVSRADLERLSRIHEAAERALCHTRSLVEYARPAGTQVIEVDLARLVQNALIFCEHEITQSKIRASLSFDGLKSPILGVPGQLTQLFVNLFTNAAHAARSTQAELRIEGSIDANPRYALVKVSDNGIGIKSADLERVFDPFFTTKSEGRGFGLGLAIVRDIVIHHGGRIHVDSEPNVGTSFSLWLPVLTPSSANSTA